MADVVDLTLSDDDEQACVDVGLPPCEQQRPVGDNEAQQDDAAEDEAAQARKRIMEFAKNMAAKRSRAMDGAGPSSTAAAAAAAAAGAPTPPLPADAAAAGAGNSSAPPPAAAAAAAAGGGGGGSSLTNADLRALHEARMRRMQQQQPAAAAGSDNAQQQPGSSSAAAAAGSDNAQQQPGSSSAAAAAAAAGSSGSGGSKTISLLTYNVWFREDVAVIQRMMAIGDIVKQAGLPTFICLQEVTPFILELLVQMEWWGAYAASPFPPGDPYFTVLLVKKAAAPGISSSSFSNKHFPNSVMGRSLRSVATNVGGNSIVVATSHLESPCPPGNFYSLQRQQQMAEALRTLNSAAAGNVLFAGDMNWDEKRDGAPQLPAGWQDAWLKLQGDNPGMTYDTTNNPMLPWKGLRVRLDRILCKLRDWRLTSISMVGTQPLPGVTYTHTRVNKKARPPQETRTQLPVLPSDHFGLLLQLEEV